MAEKTINDTNALTHTNEPSPSTREETRYLVPAVDIFETDSGLTLMADVPGVDDSGLDVRVENDVLTIKGKVSHISPDGHTWREFELLDYYRQFQLNEKVDSEKISATLSNGVLRVDLPKPAKAQPRRIEVKSD